MIFKIWCRARCTSVWLHHWQSARPVSRSIDAAASNLGGPRWLRRTQAGLTQDPGQRACRRPTGRARAMRASVLATGPARLIATRRASWRRRSRLWRGAPPRQRSGATVPSPTPNGRIGVHRCETASAPCCASQPTRRLGTGRASPTSGSGRPRRRVGRCSMACAATGSTATYTPRECVSIVCARVCGVGRVGGGKGDHIGNCSAVCRCATLVPFAQL